MGYALLHTFCAGCKAIIVVNPNYCPSLVQDGERRAICRKCVDKWNEIHRTSQGLEPVDPHPEAYEPLPSEEL